jgi:hypothetical protein
MTDSNITVPTSFDFYDTKNSHITFNEVKPDTLNINEVIRLDSKGFHYRGQFIEDAGEAHRLMVEFLKQNINIK